MMNILIKNALLEGKKTNILVEGDRIAEIGAKAGGKKDIVLDASKKAAFPGLINAHTHAAMTLLRGYADDLPLQEWLENHIWPLEAKLTAKDVYWGTKLACLEMIKSGTTCFNDMYWHMENACKAVEESGIRGFMSSVFIDLNDKEKAEEQIKENKRLISRLKGRFSSRITLTLGPHSIYTVSEESLRWIKEYADKNNHLIHIHLSETEKEVKDRKKASDMRPVEYLGKIGFLGPNLVCAHSVWLDDKEINLLAKNNVKIAHCPTSNMKLAVGSALKYEKLKKAGVKVALGTDGCASNNNLDMLEAMKFASLLQKFHWNNQTALPACEALELATVNGAKTLNLKAGEIKEGMLADIILIDLNKPELTPRHNLVSDLVYSANGSCVDTVICDGKILMQNRTVDGEQELLEKTKEITEDIIAR